MDPYGSVWAHIKTGRSPMAHDHFWTPPDPKKGHGIIKHPQKNKKSSRAGQVHWDVFDRCLCSRRPRAFAQERNFSRDCLAKVNTPAQAQAWPGPSQIFESLEICNPQKSTNKQNNHNKTVHLNSWSSLQVETYVAEISETLDKASVSSSFAQSRSVSVSTTIKFLSLDKSRSGHL